jgi:hypothetical protein
LTKKKSKYYIKFSGDYSAAKMKQKSMLSYFDSEDKRSKALYTPRVKKEITNDGEETKIEFDKDRVNRASSKGRKFMENASSLHDKDFYSRNMKSI